MSEANPIGRTDDPDAVETLRPSSADADHEAAYAAPAEDEPDADDLRESADDDRAAGYGRSAGDQDELDAEAADDITVRLTEGR